MSYYYEIRPSGDGDGLFAVVDIAPGTLIATGAYRDIIEPRRDDPVWPWLFLTSNGWRAVFADIAILNHRDTPNAEVEWELPTRECRLYAGWGGIEADTEITMRYANWEDYGCGS